MAKNIKRKIIEHLKGDIKGFQKEKKEDKALIRTLKKEKNMARKRKAASMPKAKAKIRKVMEEFKTGSLRSGSKKGPKVKSRKQAIAIGLSEARKAGAKIPKLKKKK